MIRRMFLIAVLLLVALPLAAEPAPGARPWRVTLAVHAGDDSAAVAKRLAAMYRGELVTPVDENGSFLIALTDAAAALLGEDPGVHSVQADPAGAVPSPPVAVAPMGTPPAVAHGSTSWPLGTYSYDGSGNIKKAGSDVYVYDGNNRLVSGTAAGKSEKYTYDAFGNILAIETSGSPRRLLGVDPASNRMDRTSGVFAGRSVTYDMTAGYDGNGNVTSYMLDRFEYDGVNVLRKAHVAGKWRSYVYNAGEERIGVIERSSESGGETRSDWTFRNASGQVLRRLSREAGQWQWNQDYVYRDGQMLASEVGAPVKRYQYHLDHLGTPRLITGNGGVEISRHTYLPFGAEVDATPGQNPADGEWKKFTGHERDQGSIDYMHARYYNPFMGRFLSVDPLVPSSSVTFPQRWNRYAYVMNNPMRFTDPMGLDPTCHTVKDKDGKDQVICAETVTVERKAPPRSLLNFSFPYLSWAVERRTQKANEGQPNKSTFTPSRCQSLFAVVQRESREGTQRAAARSSNTWGDRTIGQFNVDFNTRGNPTLSNGTMIDVDWFTDINSYTGNMPSAAPAAYVFGKSFWHAAGGTKGWPFQDPGEVTAVAYASRGASYNEIYNKACP